MSITQDDILAQLNNIKNRQRPVASPYQDFLPKAVPGFTMKDQSVPFQTQVDAVMATNKAKYLDDSIRHQNELSYQRMMQAQKQYAAAQNALKNAQAGAASANYGAAPSSFSMKSDPTPFDPNAGLITRNWHGRNLTLNASVMNNFIGFLNALSGEGYKINSLGTYANRNIAGTNTKSLHSYGLAMDINPSQNPVTWNGVPITNLPPNIGQLAAKYGLAWGGQWHGSKRDTMHFSIPYLGLK